jgi:hypothetical protein
MKPCHILLLCIQEVLPVDVLEIIIKTAAKQFILNGDSTTLHCEDVVYQNLASVSYSWWMTLHGWPGSTTKFWFRHQLRKEIEGYQL